MVCHQCHHYCLYWLATVLLVSTQFGSGPACWAIPLQRILEGECDWRLALSARGRPDHLGTKGVSSGGWPPGLVHHATTSVHDVGGHTNNTRRVNQQPDYGPYGSISSTTFDSTKFIPTSNFSLELWPGGRKTWAFWIDTEGCLVIYGGESIDVFEHADMWRLDPSRPTEWMLVNHYGDSTVNKTEPVFKTIGGHPGSRVFHGGFASSKFYYTYEGYDGLPTPKVRGDLFAFGVPACSPQPPSPYFTCSPDTGTWVSNQNVTLDPSSPALVVDVATQISGDVVVFNGGQINITTPGTSFLNISGCLQVANQADPDLTIRFDLSPDQTTQIFSGGLYIPLLESAAENCGTDLDTVSKQFSLDIGFDAGVFNSTPVPDCNLLKQETVPTKSGSRVSLATLVMFQDDPSCAVVEPPELPVAAIACGVIGGAAVVAAILIVILRFTSCKSYTSVASAIDKKT